VQYRAGDPQALADALVAATYRNPGVVRAQALERFDFEAVVARTRSAIGL
jgi:hypothetical protein